MAKARHGNKEAKKPKKAPHAPAPPGDAMPVLDATTLPRPKRRG